MNNIKNDTDITTRDIVLLSSMLTIVLLILIGILCTFDENVCYSIWKAISENSVTENFFKLWRSLIC